MSEESLVLSFEPNTIEHLGVKMYSHIPPALAELIANSYDACSSIVNVRLYDGSNKRVIVEDNGSGMSFDEVNEFFLRIGRNRRKENQESACDRIPTGKKGLGKLALFGIGDVIHIETTKENETVKFTLDWNEISSWEGKEYMPKFERIAVNNKPSGTTIVLESLKRVSDFSVEDYSRSISRLFNFPDANFKVYLSLNDGDPILIDNKLKYDNITPEFSWKFSKVIALFESEYSKKNEINGEIITTEKPLKPGLRGITLFANGRMVNAPEFFGRSDSSHFFSYATGWLDVDFIDNVDDDLISTDRQSISWEHELTAPLRSFLSECLRALESDWRNKRKDKRREKVQVKTNININTWLKTVPPEILEKLEPIINKVDSSELSPDEQSETIQNLHSLVPEYPNLHWRNLHQEIKNVSEKYYKTQDYYTAFLEGLKRYISEVRKRSGSTNGSDRSMMGEVFSNRKLSVTKKYLKTDGSDFSKDTKTNIEEGQHYLSEGIVLGGRNPLSHEEHLQLAMTGLFSEKDCLDFLSLLSHLFKRLEDSEKP